MAPGQIDRVLKGIPKPSPIEWLILAIGTALLLRYSWLLDDAYIYFRYVDNLILLKNGLVFNAGEFTEGFSSPAWCLILALFRLSGIPYWVIVRALGVVCFAVFWWLMVVMNRRMSPEVSSSAVINFPLLHLALTYGASCYFTSGTESPLIFVVAAACAVLVTYPHGRVAQVLAGLAPFVRPELAIPFLIVAVYCGVRCRRAPLWLIGSCLGSLGPWMVFRVFYYADLFPNTFYLKNTAWYSQGLRYIYDCVVPYQTVPILVLLAVLFFALRSSGDKGLRAVDRIIMLVIASPVIFYVIKIGGDGRHFRYLIFPYVLVFCSSAGLLERLLVRLGFQERPRVILAFALALAMLTVSGFPRQLHFHPLLQRQVKAQAKDYSNHLRIHDAAIHRTRYTPPFMSTGADEEMADLKRNFPKEVVGIPERVVISPTCAKSYREWDAYVVHSFGLTDSFLARVVMKSERPGHKEGLKSLAGDLALVRTKFGLGRGVFRKAVESGEAPVWISQNLSTLEMVEMRAYNQHEFSKNLVLAFGTVPGMSVSNLPRPD